MPLSLNAKIRVGGLVSWLFSIIVIFGICYTITLFAGHVLYRDEDTGLFLCIALGSSIACAILALFWTCTTVFYLVHRPSVVIQWAYTIPVLRWALDLPCEGDDQQAPADKPNTPETGAPDPKADLQRLQRVVKVLQTSVKSADALALVRERISHLDKALIDNTRNAADNYKRISENPSDVVAVLERDLENHKQALASINPEIQRAEDVNERLSVEVRQLKDTLVSQAAAAMAHRFVSYVRIRPQVGAEPKSCIVARSRASLSIAKPSDDAPAQTYTADRVFGPEESTLALFHGIEAFLRAAIDQNRSLCVIADGESGSGKTYTMLRDDGIILRSIKCALEVANELTAPEKGANCTVSALDIYQEKPTDLLRDYNATILPNARAAVSGGSSVMVPNDQAAHDIVAYIRSARNTNTTIRNPTSSRGFLVCEVYVRLDGVAPLHLVLVDLAGSERDGHNDACARATEADSINKTRTALGIVIKERNEGGDAYVRGNESKLAKLLRPLLRNSTSWLVCLSTINQEAEHYPSTAHTLKTAASYAPQRRGAVGKTTKATTSQPGQRPIPTAPSPRLSQLGAAGRPGSTPNSPRFGSVPRESKGHGHGT